jgi:hypothetical protein
MQMNPNRKRRGYRIAQIATGALVVAAVATSFTIWFQGESVLAQGQTSSAVFPPDAVAAFNPTERIKGKTIIRVRP